MSSRKKAIVFGLLGGGALTLFYLAVSWLAMPTVGAIWDNISQFWYLMVILIAGFGIQVGLSVYIKDCQRGEKLIAGTSGAMSAGAMLACCVHHLTDVLPILGASGLAVFLVQYQKPLLILGVAINLLGLAYMLKSYSQVKKAIYKEHDFTSV